MNFLQYLKYDLIPHLKQPSLIIMDNASYHTALPSDAPKNLHKLTRQQLIDTLRGFQQEASSTELRTVLANRLKVWRDTNIPPAAVTLLKDHGHQVLFTPPRLCELQPIERIFGILKGRVGRRHFAGLEFAETRTMLEEEIERLHKERHHNGKPLVEAVIDASFREVERYRKLMDHGPETPQEVNDSVEHDEGWQFDIDEENEMEEAGNDDDDDDDDDSDHDDSEDDDDGDDEDDGCE